VGHGHWLSIVTKEFASDDALVLGGKNGSKKKDEDEKRRSHSNSLVNWLNG
jgi:hypothetical protein